MTKSRCKCGAVKSQYAHNCRKCEKIQREENNKKYSEILRTGVCPQCGAGLHHNYSMTGWYQCDQYGAEGFRKDSSKPSCSFQFFITKD